MEGDGEIWEGERGSVGDTYDALILAKITGNRPLGAKKPGIEQNTMDKGFEKIRENTIN